MQTLTLIETTMLAHDGLLGWDEALLVLGESHVRTLRIASGLALLRKERESATGAER